MSARRLTSLFAALLLVQVLSLPVLFAQSTTSTVKGRVVDTDGTGLPGVVVVIKSKTQPSGNKQVVTDIEGNYRIPLLPPANDYIIRVDYPGFAPMELGPLDLDAGKTTVADLTLRSDAETTETIVVESKGNIVDTESTKTSSSYNAEFIEGLPIIGSNYQDILTLAPGVTDTDGDGNPNVHGARDTGLQYRLDGGNITDPASGTFGQNLNPDIIEELEVITSGASAEYGRADGGFANVITKSGGNDFEGKFSFRWRGRFLDGDGANNNDVNTFEDTYPNFTDIRPILSVGGAIVRDRLWYFGSVEILDSERPVNQPGNPRIRTARGNYGFAKLTWQTNSYNKLALQVNSDPLSFKGNNIALGVSPDSDFEFKQGGITPQLKWTSTISPQLLLESQITHYVSGIALTPISRYFTPTQVTQVITNNNTIQALYPCEVPNCDPQAGEKRIYQLDLIAGTVNGPFFTQTDDTRTRNSIKTDLSYTLEDAWGQHNIKSGIEFADEKFEDYPILNPFLVDITQPYQSTVVGGGGQVAPNAVQGSQLLTTFEPLQTQQNASSFNSGFYLLDAWKPRPNLTVNLGIRVDREDIDTSGFDYFDPRQERRKSITLWRHLCDAIRDQGLQGGTLNCTDPALYDGRPPGDYSNNLIVNDPNHPVTPDVVALDLNGDGLAENQGAEGAAQYKNFTVFADRQTNNFSIVNTNTSPRFSISWDPWADGKTKAFGSWGRFYDRLFLNTVTGEIGPDRINYTFRPDPTTHVISTSPRAISRVASSVSITQIDRNMDTPYTDELTLGFERELAPEWSASITYIRRKGYNLLQDVDINHVTCPQYGEEFGIDPYLICGDGGFLELDKFGDDGTSPSAGNVEGGSFSFDRSFSAPNGAPDLYTVNNGFNQILRIGNNNSSDYEAYELKVVKRLHRNWQMQASYTWSKATGQAENFQSGLGNDPQTKDDEAGYLDFDQRHILKFQAVTRLPHEISVGANIEWHSGTPWSQIQTVVDQDSTGNQIFRQFYPTRQRNDQRNDGEWLIDTRIEKNFVIGKVQAGGFFNIQNILDVDTLAITDFDVTALNGIPLNAQRNFGRRFEIGAIFNF